MHTNISHRLIQESCNETRIEVIYGIRRPLREYQYRKDRDINHGQITDEQRIALLEESWAEYDAKVKDIKKSNFDEYTKHL